MINHFLGNDIWSNVVIIAMGGLKKHPVEVRCQGATTAAKKLPRDPNRPKINFTGRLVSHELEVPDRYPGTTEEEARETIQNVLNTLKAQTVRTCNLILVDSNFSG